MLQFAHSNALIINQSSNSMIFCCDEINAKYAPVEGVLPPGLRRQSQQDVALNPANPYLVKTAGNAFCEAQPSSSDRRVLGMDYQFT